MARSRLGATVMKHSAKKIRRLYNDKILAGFAGSTADASRSSAASSPSSSSTPATWAAARWLSQGLAPDKLLRQLQALLIVADGKQMFLLSGDGDVIEPDPLKDGRGPAR